VPLTAAGPDWTRLTTGLAAGPFVALLAIAALGLVLRWTFGHGGPTFPTEAPDYGLLQPVAVVSSQAEAHAIQAQLAQASIRATTSCDQYGRHHVLVFGTDHDRARALLG
jgi:hypothetical protein